MLLLHVLCNSLVEAFLDKLPTGAAGIKKLKGIFHKELVKHKILSCNSKFYVHVSIVGTLLSTCMQVKAFL